MILFKVILKKMYSKLLFEFKISLVILIISYIMHTSSVIEIFEVQLRPCELNS